jgi:preprotein translocase subunit SecA
VSEKMTSNRLAWYGHVMQRDESYITKRVMTMIVDGYPSRDRPRKRWMDCVKDDMKINGVSMEMTSDRRE